MRFVTPDQVLTDVVVNETLPTTLLPKQIEQVCDDEKSTDLKANVQVVKSEVQDLLSDKSSTDPPKHIRSSVYYKNQ